MLHWYCKATYNWEFFCPKATYNLGRREYDATIYV